MAYLAIVSMGDGRRAGFRAVAGVALGLLSIGILVSLGMGELVARSPLLYEGLRYGGCFYLIYLAYDGWIADPGISGKNRPRSYFFHGFLNNVLNPKAALFYATVFPTFIQEGAPVLSTWLTLCLLYVGLATLIHASIVSMAGLARRFFEDANRRRKIQRGLSLLLVAVAVWLFVSTKR